ARGVDRVGGPGPARAALDGLEPVFHDTKVEWLGAGLGHLSHERVGVGVRDLSGAGLYAEIGDLVPRGQDRHARPAVDERGRVAERGEQTDLRGSEGPARLEHAITGGDVFTARSDIGAALDGPGDADT